MINIPAAIIGYCGLHSLVMIHTSLAMITATSILGLLLGAFAIGCSNSVREDPCKHCLSSLLQSAYQDTYLKLQLCGQDKKLRKYESVNASNKVLNYAEGVLQRNEQGGACKYCGAHQRAWINGVIGV